MKWSCEAVASLWKHAQNWETQRPPQRGKKGRKKHASVTQERICARVQVRDNTKQALASVFKNTDHKRMSETL